MRKIFQNRCRNFPKNGNILGPEFSPRQASFGSLVQQNVLIAQFIYLVTVGSHHLPIHYKVDNFSLLF